MIAAVLTVIASLATLAHVIVTGRPPVPSGAEVDRWLRWDRSPMGRIAARNDRDVEALDTEISRYLAPVPTDGLCYSYPETGFGRRTLHVSVSE